MPLDLGPDANMNPGGAIAGCSDDNNNGWLYYQK